jgi:hypothetical protein
LTNCKEKLESQEKLTKFVSLSETQIKNLAKKYKSQKTKELSEQALWDNDYQYDNQQNSNIQFDNGNYYDNVGNMQSNNSGIFLKFNIIK